MTKRKATIQLVSRHHNNGAECAPSLSQSAECHPSMTGRGACGPALAAPTSASPACQPTFTH
jgi:hypothetical protein